MKLFHLYKWILLSLLTTSVSCSCSNDSNTEEIDDYATDTSIAVTGNTSTSNIISTPSA